MQEISPQCLRMSLAIHCKNKRVALNQLHKGISVASSLPKNVHTGRSVTLFAQHKTFMAPTILKLEK